MNDLDLLSNSSGTATNISTGNNISVSPDKTSKNSTTSTSNQTKIHKPILMCFICKLSFGNTKSFTLHASTEHQVNLQESEKLLLSREYSSAILQRNNDEKPQLSFLEPLEQQQQQQQSSSLVSMKQQQELQQKLINDFVQQIQKQAIAANSNNNNDQQQMNDQSSAMLLNNSSSSSLLKSPNHLAHNSSSSSSNNTSSMSPSSHAKHTNNSGTDNSSSANNNTNNNLTNSSSSVMNSQQQSSSLNQQNSPSSSTSSAVANINNNSSSAATQQQQQQLLASTNAAAAAKLLSEFLHQQQQQFQRSLQCSEHQGQQGVDCKNCEMLNITGLRSPLTPSKSPNSSVCGDMTSPTTSTPLPQSSGGTHLNLSPGAPSFTIGACPEHINGRPIGVECAR